jgi:hypothetical protein
MAFEALRFAWRFGSEVPFWEEWLYVPYAIGETPISLSWLWEQSFEHRTPLHKLLIFGSFSVFGLDERPILLLDVGLLALLAAAMIWAVRRVRGGTSYADAFFPFVLLNFGHAETFYWAGTNVYVLATLLSGMILVTLYVTGSRLTSRSAALVGACLVLLTLTFGGGLIYAACMSCGLGYFGLRLIRSTDPADRRAGRILLASVGLVLMIVALYFVGYRKSSFSKTAGEFRMGPAAVVKMTITFLTAAFSWGGWGPFARYMRWAMTALVSIAVGCLAAEFLRRRPRGWQPLLGLGLHLGSCLIVALAVGYGRAPWGPQAIESSRYAAAAAPTLLCLYFIWEACGPALARPLGRAALCGLVFAFLAVNWMKGGELGWEHRSLQEAFRADVRAGKPIPYLISRHAAATYYIHERLEEYLRLLRDRRYGEYANLPPDPSFREVPLPSSPSAVSGLVWDGKRGRSTSNDPEMVFDLPRPMRIAGIRMRYSSENPGGWNPLLEVGWRRHSEEHGKEWRRYEHLQLRSGVPKVVTGWIYDTVDRIRIRPDIRPCDFTLSDVVLLVPDPPTDPTVEGSR